MLSMQDTTLTLTIKQTLDIDPEINFINWELGAERPRCCVYDSTTLSHYHAFIRKLACMYIISLVAVRIIVCL
jgi:hypothetical protein